MTLTISDETFALEEYSVEDERKNIPTEIAGAKHHVTLDDLRLNEIWGATDGDLRVIKAFGEFLEGEAGYRAETFPSFLTGTEPYKAIIHRGTLGDGLGAKTLLAVIMEMDHIQRLNGFSEHTGSLVDGYDSGLHVFRRIAVPILVPDLGVYAGWTGYKLPEKVEQEKGHRKKESGVMRYTRDWIMDKLANDSQMSHLVESAETTAMKESIDTTKVLL
jgi:hypothetical protein